MISFPYVQKFMLTFNNPIDFVVLIYFWIVFWWYEVAVKVLHYFRLTWPCLISLALSTRAKLFQPSGDCGIYCTFTFCATYIVHSIRLQAFLYRHLKWSETLENSGCYCYTCYEMTDQFLGFQLQINSYSSNWNTPY